MSHHAHHNYCSLFLQKMTDFKEQCIYIKLLFQTSKIGAETFQMLTLAFREEAMLIVQQSTEMEWHLSRMLNIHGACLPAACIEMWNIFTGFGMNVAVLLSTIWLMSFLVYAIKFWHQIEFMIDCVKISALYVDWWVETIRIASVYTRMVRRNVRHSHFLSEVVTDDSMGSPCLK